MKTFPIEEKSDETTDRHIETEVRKMHINGYREEDCREGEAEKNIQRDADGPHLSCNKPKREQDIVNEPSDQSEDRSHEENVDLLAHLKSFLKLPFAP